MATSVRRERQRGRIILIIGGASSGKSDVALELALKGQPSRSPRAFVATGQPLDEEMAEKIKRHQVRRGTTWDTQEVPVDLVAWFQKNGASFRTIILDCLTLWLSNLRERQLSEGQIHARVADLLGILRDVRTRVVVVTNELGLGLVPQEASARGFRDLAGEVNQRFASEADEVHVILSGIPLRLK